MTTPGQGWPAAALSAFRRAPQAKGRHEQTWDVQPNSQSPKPQKYTHEAGGGEISGSVVVCCYTHEFLALVKKLLNGFECPQKGGYTLSVDIAYKQQCAENAFD